MDLVDLLERYVEVNTMQLHDAWIAWDEGAIDKFDLMDAYLESEGIFGYGYAFRNLIGLLDEL